MKRRGFCSLVFGVLCAPFLPKPKVSGLMFHKDAFAFDWPAIEAGYFYRSQDVACTVEEFAERCRPHLEAAQRQLAEVIDRG